ncbi:MAG: IS1595 family transposase [Candidatus Sulfotelmatobacter sp.]
MNLLDVTKKLQTEDQCLDFIERVRWPDGKIRCVECGNDKVSRITRTVDPSKSRQEKKQNKRTRLYACLEPTCKHRFTPTVGTLFHDSHLPLTKWFMAVALIVHAKKGMSAKQVQRHLGVNYRTAWYMGHRIRKAMHTGALITPAPESRPKMKGIVEVDETWVGGKVRGKGKGHENKEIVMGIRERGGDLRLFHIPDVSAKSLSKPIQENISPAAEKVMTDEYPAYPLAMMASGIHGEKHNTIRHRDRIYVRGDVYTNTIESAFSLFKRGIVGSFHSVSGKHLHRYLSEFEYRFNGREMPDLFGATVAHLVGTKEMKYRELIAN